MPDANPLMLQVSPTRICPEKLKVAVFPVTCPVKVPSPLATETPLTTVLKVKFPLVCPPGVTVPEKLIWITGPAARVSDPEPLNASIT